MTFPVFLPWQREIAQAWLGQRERFAHAWLIHGQAGIGKRDFANAAAASLLCETPVEGLACGQCQACGWLASGNHPDLRRVLPEALALEEGANAATGEDEEGGATASSSKRAPSRDIRIEQLRKLESWFNTGTHRGGWRVAVIYPAQALNAISANGLLKILEEPPPNTVFLMVADAPDRLLPTLLSRCRRLPLPVPTAAQAAQWLAQQQIPDASAWLAAAGGAPIAAAALAASGDEPCPAWLKDLCQTLAQGREPDVGSLVEQVEKREAAQWLDALQRLQVDLMLASVGADVRYFPSLASLTQALAKRVGAMRIGAEIRWLAAQRAVAGHPLNAKLFAHSVFQRLVLSWLPR